MAPPALGRRPPRSRLKSAPCCVRTSKMQAFESVASVHLTLLALLINAILGVRGDHPRSPFVKHGGVMKLGIVIGRASALICTAAAVFIIVTSPTRAQTNPTIPVSALSIESSAEVYYAKDMGFFTKAGLDVDIQSLPGGSPAIGAAIAGGTLYIGYGGIDTLASIHAKGIPVIVIAPANEYLSPRSLHTTAMVVPLTSSVQNAGPQRKNRRCRGAQQCC
jgi:hypothetical protein